MHIHIDTDEIKSREFRLACLVGKTLSGVFKKQQKEKKSLNLFARTDRADLY